MKQNNLIEKALAGLKVVETVQSNLPAVKPEILKAQDFHAAITLIAGFNGEAEPTATDVILAKWAVTQFEITREDFEFGFKAAFSDKYTGSKMTMKHVVVKVEERRKTERENAGEGQPRFTFNDVCNWFWKRHYTEVDYRVHFDLRKDAEGTVWYYLKPASRTL